MSKANAELKYDPELPFVVGFDKDPQTVVARFGNVHYAMNFTKATYRKARSRAMNEVYSRADILEWSKEHLRGLGEPTPETYWEHMDRGYLVDEARTEYFKALETAKRIVERGRREKGLWR